MGTLENTFAAGRNLTIGLALRVLVALIVFTTAYGIATSPIPFGARMLHAGSLVHEGGPQEFAVYEIPGADAIKRVRESAERNGYTVVQADVESVVLLRDRTRIVARRGRPLQGLISPSGDVSTDAFPGSAVILVMNPVPQWRAALHAY